MTTNVTLVEFSSWDNVTPLVSGYLQTYAQKDPLIRAECSFRIYTQTIPVDVGHAVAELVAHESDLYALSCYMWNMTCIRRVLRDLLVARPEARFILGGPQVMEHAAEYVAPGESRVTVCNGEGEISFYQYLRHIVCGAFDFSTVPGITFWSDGRFVTTPRPPRIKTLDEVPSPFTAGLFEPGKYTNAILETNRGCPFSCGFCYWGAATNDKVYKFDADRAESDIRWISENGCLNLFIADANWGVSPRDVELSRHIVDCSKQNGYPLMVYMAAAKNKSDRVAEIAEIFSSGGLINSQPISLQTVSDNALRLIDRKNIKEETYITLQRVLREKGISSYVEIIWPLPGETLDSFQRGAMRLCRSMADSVVMHPHLLLHNTPISRNQQLHGIRTRDLRNESGEAEVVVATHWVSEEECMAGYWYYMALLTLYNLRGLYFLALYLDSAGLGTYQEFFASAARFFAGLRGDRLTTFLHRCVDEIAMYDLLNQGTITHLILHELRDEFDHLLCHFVSSEGWLVDDTARAAFELDLLARPYVYLEPASLPKYEFAELHLVNHNSDGYKVRVPAEILALASTDGRFIIDMPADRVLLTISHGSGNKLPCSAGRELAQCSYYCHGMMLRVREMLPRWTCLADSGEPAHA
jgi:radical SAM superfamily enzyme YgiQ (UPF0313 family)